MERHGLRRPFAILDAPSLVASRVAARERAGETVMTDWIPACAGMTVRGGPLALRSRLVKKRSVL